MGKYWTKKADGHEEEAKTVAPWEEAIDGGDKEFPDPEGDS